MLLNGNRRTGFTLIELFMVMAIIAVLAAILTPVFARARAQADEDVCLGNVRQLILASVMYEQDWGFVPPRSLWTVDPDYTSPSHWGGYYRHWGHLLQPYLRGSEVLICPTSGGQAGEMQEYGLTSSYAQNGLHFRHWEDMDYSSSTYGCANTSYKIFTQVLNPAATMFVAEINNATMQFGPAVYCPLCEASFEMWPEDGAAGEEEAWGIATTRHGGGGYYGFVDGHVDSFTYQEVTAGIRAGASDEQIMWCKQFWGHGDPHSADPCE